MMLPNFNFYKYSDAKNSLIKTPIMLLQEICIKSKLQVPKYELVSFEGPIHLPNFKYKCIINLDFYCIGTSNTQQKAKHCAAYNMLKKIVQFNIGKNDELVKNLENLMYKLKNFNYTIYKKFKLLI